MASTSSKDISWIVKAALASMHIIGVLALGSAKLIYDNQTGLVHSVDNLTATLQFHLGQHEGLKPHSNSEIDTKSLSLVNLDYLNDYSSIDLILVPDSTHVKTHGHGTSPK